MENKQLADWLFLKVLMGITVGILCFGFESESVSATISAGLSTTGGVLIKVLEAGESGVSTGIGTDTLTAVTNCPFGYNVYISSSVDDANLYRDGDDTKAAISAVSGLAMLSPNTWGYSLTNIVSGSFKGLTSVSASLGTERSALTGGPLYETTATSAAGTEISVYYGVQIDKNAEPGDYYMKDGGAVQYLMTVDTACMGYRMQDVEEWGEIVGDGGTLISVDARDGTEYMITRLGDGKLWMTQNLRLAMDNAIITVENTNNPTQEFLESYRNEASSDSWCTDTSCTNQIKYNTSNLGDTRTDATGHSYDDYGVYYNWYAATAGNSSSVLPGANVAGDICSKGWHLPTGKESGEFYRLNEAINSGAVSPNAAAGLLAEPANFVFSGRWRGSGRAVGTMGFLWTATAHDYFNANAYLLSMSNGSVNAGTNSDYIYVGFGVRCVAD